MSGTGWGRNRVMAGVPATVMVLFLAAAAASPPDAGKGRDSMSGIHDAQGAVRSTLPEIDRRIPARMERATFALG